MKPAVPLALVVALVWSMPAAAQNEPLGDNEFTIDFVTGPVLGLGRIVGLGGAYTALAYGVDGASWNPASYASRGWFELDWFAWDIALGLIPTTLRNTDFDNNGESGFTYDDFVFASVGLGFQLGEFGFGGLLRVQSYSVGDTTDVTLAVGNYGVGYNLWRGQLVVGLSARTASLTIRDTVSSEALVEFTGTGGEVGGLLKLARQPWRLGVAARSPVESNRPDALVAAGLTLPETIRLPWEVQIGLAWQFGPRPLNPTWINPRDAAARVQAQLKKRRRQRERAQVEEEARDRRMKLATQSTPPTLAHERRGTGDRDRPQDPQWWQEETKIRWKEEREALRTIDEDTVERRRRSDALSRRYLIVSAETILIGPTENGVGLESFLSQVRQTSGEDLSVGLRLGAETEPLEGWVKFRAGTYLEPSRFASVGYRAHGTFGGDVRLFDWDTFGLFGEFTLKATTSVDVAERYLNWSLGLGAWH